MNEKVCPLHLSDLQASGLSADTIAASGLFCTSQEEVKSILKFDAGCGGLVIPYLNHNGDPPYYRVKPDSPKLSADGKKAKYLSPEGGGNRLYIPSMICMEKLQSMRMPLLIVEGEKKSLSAAQHDIVCIAIPGVWSWKDKDGMLKEFDRIYLKKRSVYICFDSDILTNPKVQAAQVALTKALRKRGAIVQGIDIPPGPDGKKIGLDDYLLDHSPESFWSLPLSDPLDFQSTGQVLLAGIVPEPVTWLWRGYIPLGKITLIDGDPGLGKSVLALDLAARLTKGNSFPDGSACQPAGVVILTLEDGLADTVVPRLKAAGADLSKVVALNAVTDRNGKPRSPLITDTAAMVAAIERVKARLLIIDPLMGYLGGKTDYFKDQDMRGQLAPLARMVEEQGVAGTIIRHLTKGGGSQSIYRGQGSIGIVGAARCALLVAKDPEDESLRVLAGIKNNLAPMPLSLRFHLVDHNGTAKVEWDGGSVHSADQLLAASAGSIEDRSAVDEAQAFLRELLTGGSRPAKEIIKQARAAGISERTLNRAKKVLGIKSEKEDFSGTWVWMLPKVAKPYI